MSLKTCFPKLAHIISYYTQSNIIFFKGENNGFLIRSGISFAFYDLDR